VALGMNGARVARAHDADRAEWIRTLWTAALIGVVWAWIIVPKIIQSVLSPKYRNSVGVTSAPYSRIAAFADAGLYLAVIAVCVLIILGYLNTLDWRGSGLLLCLLLPWAYIALRDVYVPTRLLEEGVCYPLIVIAVWILKPDLRRLEILGYLIGATAAVSVLLALAMPTHAIFRSATGQVIVDDKQIIPGGLLVGVFTQGNNLGQFLALGLPTVFLIRRRRVRLALAAVSAFAVLWSASRGAMLALGVGAVAYLAVRVTPPVVRRLVAPLVVMVPVVVVCVVPLVTTAPAAFTNRGLVWLVSLKAWSSDPWVGLGANWYEVVGSSSSRIAGSVFHGHNQFVQFLVTGGILFTLAVVPQLVAGLIRATRASVHGDLFGITWLAVLAGSCSLEKSFSYVDNANFLAPMVLPFAFLLLARSRADRESGGEAATPPHPARPHRTVGHPDQRPGATGAGRRRSAHPGTRRAAAVPPGTGRSAPPRRSAPVRGGPIRRGAGT
jgi:hypothetical protein